MCIRVGPHTRQHIALLKLWWMRLFRSLTLFMRRLPFGTGVGEASDSGVLVCGILSTTHCSPYPFEDSVGAVMKPKVKKFPKRRNWEAVSAHFRKAGSMKDIKREQDKYSCRNFKHEGCHEHDKDHSRLSQLS